jgi:hypothetical protein
VVHGGPGFYDAEGTGKLADLVGRSNYGIHYRPYLSAAESAESWLRSQKGKAKTQKERDAWGRWGVVQADLDADQTTLIMLSHSLIRREAKLRLLMVMS